MTREQAGQFRDVCSNMIREWAGQFRGVCVLI